MAVPTNAVLNRTAPLKSGVLIGVSPSSDPTFDVEFARATSSGVYSTVARLTPKGGGVPVVFTDLLPVDGKSRSYKARAVKDGWQGGDYTAVLTVKPTYLPEVVPNVTPVTGQQLGVKMFISTGSPVTYGKADLAQRYDKTFVLYPFQFKSTATSVAYQANDHYLWPQSTAKKSFYAPFEVSENSQVATIDFLYTRPSTKGTIRVVVSSLAPSTLSATVIDYTATGSGAGIFTKTFTSGFTVGGIFYNVRVDITSTSGSSGSVRLRGYSANYAVPSVAVGV